MSPTKEQRAAMAAHLCDLAAKALRSGGPMADTLDLLDRAWGTAADSSNVEASYREGLKLTRAAPADIDAAVASIARGEHPPDSLPGRVGIYKGHADREIPRREGDRIHVLRFQGESIALGWVLEQLGCPELQQ
jgi:hypothetical protein